MIHRIYLVVLLLCCMYTVLSVSLGDDNLSEGLAECAVALNQSSINSTDINSTQLYSQLSKTICKDDDIYASCMTDYPNTVFIQTDTVSHTNATSTIRVDINSNATIDFNETYYTFCVSYNTSAVFELVGCAANSGEMLEIDHTWETNGLAIMRVGVFTKTSRREVVGCNATNVIVAGNFGLKIDMEIFDDQHHIPTVTTPTLYITNNNNTYTTGNLTFFPRPTLTRNDVSNIDRYFYKYDYGDNTTGEQYLEFNSTHLYKRPGNYSYMVQGYAINSKDSNIAYHASYNGTLVILEPVANLSLYFNHNNSIIVDTNVYLHTCANGSFPITVCWIIHQPNTTNSSKTECSSTDEWYTCHIISETYPCPSYEMKFSDTGMYEMIATFVNSISCVRVIYTFHVVAASKPPIIATTTSAGIVVAIIIAVVVVLIILAVGGYLPYRRYRNHTIETADFKFIDLSEKKPSAWSRFKRKMLRLMRSRNNTDKIGLVNLISEPGRGGATVQCNSRDNSSSSSSSSSSSLRSFNNNNNYNTV